MSFFCQEIFGSISLNQIIVLFLEVMWTYTVISHLSVIKLTKICFLRAVSNTPDSLDSRLIGVVLSLVFDMLN